MKQIFNGILAFSFILWNLPFFAITILMALWHWEWCYFEKIGGKIVEAAEIFAHTNKE